MVPALSTIVRRICQPHQRLRRITTPIPDELLWQLAERGAELRDELAKIASEARLPADQRRVHEEAILGAFKALTHWGGEGAAPILVEVLCVMASDDPLRAELVALLPQLGEDLIEPVAAALSRMDDECLAEELVCVAARAAQHHPWVIARLLNALERRLAGRPRLSQFQLR